MPIQEKVTMMTERLKADFSKNETKIHRFPQGLRIGCQADRYIAPSVVALGPYHHGQPQLQQMEEVKHAAAHYLCNKSGHPIEEVYSKILSFVGEARSCYTDDAVAKFSDADFAVMMFLDGCFLLYYISTDVEKECTLLANRVCLSTGPCLLRDIFLLENQLPWLVLHVLMTFFTYVAPLVPPFIEDMASYFNISSHSEKTKPPVTLEGPHKPPHLLGLLHHYEVGSPEPGKVEENFGDEYPSPTSAIELAEIGIKLTGASNKAWLVNMSHRRRVFGQLSLRPLFLNDITACWLVNMAAFETCTSTSYPKDGFVVCSYLCILGMLVDKEDDVHELRAKHIVRSLFSNKELLVFLKGLAHHLRPGHHYFVILSKIGVYKRHRSVRILVYKFFYNHYKTIVALISLVSVLVGIFQTLASLKQPAQPK